LGKGEAIGKILAFTALKKGSAEYDRQWDLLSPLHTYELKGTLRDLEAVPSHCTVARTFGKDEAEAKRQLVVWKKDIGHGIASDWTVRLWQYPDGSWAILTCTSDAEPETSEALNVERERLLATEWDKVLDHPEDFGGRQGVGRIIEKAGITRDSKDALLARLAAFYDKRSLQSIHDSRSPLSQSSDERQTNLDTIDADDPRTARWQRDPGSMDVRGIDTPTKKRKPARKPKAHSSSPTSMRGTRKK
jgi:hypothetical protein